MERPLSTTGFLIAVAIAVLALLGMSAVAPHDRYHRFQNYDNVTTRKTDWIYERLHFDPTPVDLALIGTSRTGGGLSAPLLEKLYCAQTGRRIHVANFSVPEMGRNMHYAIAKEILRAKRPALIVIELNEIETRLPHRGFGRIADANDILTAPAAINANFIADLARLPGRQAELFARDVLAMAPLREKFDAGAYPGAHLDRTRELRLIDGALVNRDRTVSPERLEAMRAARLADQKPLFVSPPPLRVLEYRFARIYLARTARLAAARGAATAYVYLPAYRAPDRFPAALEETLEIGGPILAAGRRVQEEPSLWLDATHVNARGAARQTRGLARSLSDAYPRLGAPGRCPV